MMRFAWGTLIVGTLLGALAACGGDVDVGSVSIFETGFESGAVADWEQTQSAFAGSVWTYPGGEYAMVQAPVHDGRFSMSLSVDGKTQGAQAGLGRFGDFPDRHYFSAYILFTRQYVVAPGYAWQVFQLRGSPLGGASTGEDDVAWALSVDNTPDGRMRLYLMHHVPVGQWTSYVDDSVPALTVGRWIHIEAYMQQADGAQGAIRFWQDGQEIFARNGVPTTRGRRVFWGLVNIADNIQPGPATIYVDDIAISRIRLHPWQ